MYKALTYFVDLLDGGRPYQQGDIYPAEKAPKPTPERIAVLLGSNNKQGRPLISKENQGEIPKSKE